MAFIQKEYRVACFKCGNNRDIVIMPHHKEDSIEKPIVGLIYACKVCYPQIKGKNVLMDIQIEKSPNQKTEAESKTNQ